jgi:hypothetical protein
MVCLFKSSYLDCFLHLSRHPRSAPASLWVSGNNHYWIPLSQRRLPRPLMVTYRNIRLRKSKNRVIMMTKVAIKSAVSEPMPHPARPACAIRDGTLA